MKDKIISNIKERVVLIAETKGVNRLDFFSDLGLSYANFKGVQKQSALSSDAVALILDKHADINPAWLIAGEGDMFRTEALHAQEATSQYHSTSASATINVSPFQQIIASQELTIKSQDKTIHSLEKQIELLERELKLLRKD